jgi:hypothetical protein
MMNKDQFIKRMKLIQNFISEQDTLQVLINKLTDSHNVISMGDYIISEMINMIEEDLGYKDILDWWLFEDVEKAIYEDDENGNEIENSVRTLDELYDFMVNNKECLCQQNCTDDIYIIKEEDTEKYSLQFWGYETYDNGEDFEVDYVETNSMEINYCPICGRKLI